MVTRMDLSTVRMSVEPIDKSIWHYVEYKGERFILVATDVNDEDIQDIMTQDIEVGVLYLLNLLPRKDTAVFRGDSEWVIEGECDDNCHEGVCTRRLASNETVGDIELAYQLLIGYLNA